MLVRRKNWMLGQKLHGTPTDRSCRYNRTPGVEARAQAGIRRHPDSAPLPLPTDKETDQKQWISFEILHSTVSRCRPVTDAKTVLHQQHQRRSTESEPGELFFGLATSCPLSQEFRPGP